MKKSDKVAVAKANSETKPKRLGVFGPPPLIPGEDEAVYDALFVQVCTAVKPRQFLEQMWVQDVLDHVWEVLRFRRLKAQLLDACAREGLTEVLMPFLGYPGAHDLAEKWAYGDPDATKEVDRMFGGEIPMDAVMALTLSKKIEAIERIDRMIMNAEARRDKVLREIERHREALAEALRRTSEKIVEGEFKVVSENANGELPKLAA